MIEIATIERLVIVPVVAGLLTAGLIVMLAPWLGAYALARPNARSSHREPTPQGSGAAVVLAALAVSCGVGALAGRAVTTTTLVECLAVTAAAVLLAVVGAVDDIRGLSPLPRLALQCLAVGFVIVVLSADLRVAPFLPWWLERVAVFVGWVWFINDQFHGRHRLDDGRGNRADRASGLPGRDKVRHGRPPRTPSAIVDKISGDTSEVLKINEVGQRIRELGMDVAGVNPAESGKSSAQKAAHWGKIVRAAGFAFD